MNFSLLRLSLGCLLWCLGACVHAEVKQPEPLSNFPQVTVEIATPDARLHRFKAWVADTDAHREQGLMFVESMPTDRGMLFIFPRPARISFWMKNTFIPLDMIFIRADGRIDTVATNTTPHSLDLVTPRGDVQQVLEINGGLARKLGIEAGAFVRLQK